MEEEKVRTSWKGDFSNLGPLAQKVRPAILSLPTRFSSKKSKGAEKQVPTSWKGNFSNLGPLAQKVRPMKFVSK